MVILTTGYSKVSQIVALLPVVVDEFAIGLAYGWVSPTIKYLRAANDDLYLNNDQISWVASLHELGRFLGPFFVTVLSWFIGRKPILTITALLYAISWIGVLFTRSVWILYASRLIVGIGIGFSDVTTCVYVGEITTPDIRGKSMVIILALYSTGVLVAYTLGTYLSYTVHSAIILAVSALHVTSSCLLLVETPHYLVTRIGGNDEKQAWKNLVKVRGGDDSERTVREFDEIKRSLQIEECGDEQQTGFLDALKDKTTVRILSLILSIAVFSHSTGYFTVSYYSNLIFPSTDLLTSNQFTMIFGGMQLLSVCLASAVIDRYGRRFLLLIFSFSAVILHAITTVLYFVKDTYGDNTVEIPYFSWLIFLTISIYSALFVFGCSSVNFTLRTEMFPQNIKVFGASLAVLSQSGLIFLQTKMFITIDRWFGIYFNFLLFTAASLTVLVVTYFKLPETKGKTLAEIQAHFKGRGDTKQFGDT